MKADDSVLSAFNTQTAAEFRDSRIVPGVRLLLRGNQSQLRNVFFDPQQFFHPRKSFCRASPAAACHESEPLACQLLRHDKSPQRRRVILPKNITLSTLHAVIQNIYGWEDAHLHDFRTNDGKIVISMEEDGFADYPYKESDTRVNEFLEQCK